MKQLKNKRRYRLIGILLNLSKVYEKYLYTRISPCLTIPFEITLRVQKDQRFRHCLLEQLEVM